MSLISISFYFSKRSLADVISWKFACTLDRAQLIPVHVYFFQGCTDWLSDQCYCLYLSILLNNSRLSVSATGQQGFDAPASPKGAFSSSALRLCALFIEHCNLIHAKLWD